MEKLHTECAFTSDLLIFKGVGEGFVVLRLKHSISVTAIMPLVVI